VPLAIPHRAVTVRPVAFHHGDDGAPYPAAYKAANPPRYGGTSDADTQIRWGLAYLRDIYGSPCSGWAFKQAHGWY
jgi:hypothetical protein